MDNCCSGTGFGFGTKDFNEKFNWEIEKTDKGIKIHVMPKDESKVESFQKFIDACKDFCDCEC
jgi:hypothetical protein